MSNSTVAMDGGSYENNCQDQLDIIPDMISGSQKKKILMIKNLRR